MRGSPRNRFLTVRPEHDAPIVRVVNLLLFFRGNAVPDQDPEGGVPDGGVPDGGVPDGRVPFICIPSGGVPEGRVPFIAIPSGGGPEDRVPFIPMPSGSVPIAAADSLNRGLSPASDAGADSAAWAAAGTDASIVLVSTDELLSVQPAIRIPATRIDDASSIMRVLFCIELFSWMTGHALICIETGISCSDLQRLPATSEPGQDGTGRNMPESIYLSGRTSRKDTCGPMNIFQGSPRGDHPESP